MVDGVSGRKQHFIEKEESRMSMNIAIDGPAGAGKSTIAKRLAKELGFIYVDTGAMYRAMAYYFLSNGIKAEDEAAVAAACPRVDVTIAYENGEQQVILNGENVNGVIRTEEVGNLASATSVYPIVREKLVELQRQHLYILRSRKSGRSWWRSSAKWECARA